MKHIMIFLITCQSLVYAAASSNPGRKVRDACRLPLADLAQRASDEEKKPKTDAAEGSPKRRQPACSSPRLIGGITAQPLKLSDGSDSMCDYNIKSLAEFFTRADVQMVVQNKEYDSLRHMFVKEFDRIPAALIIAKDRQA